ncbi:MAG: D-alanyl-D-alanine carboxypeptidase [Candidatus Eisenbacteria bacterium]
MMFVWAETPRSRGRVATFGLLAAACLAFGSNVASASPRELVQEVQELLGSQRASGLHFAMEFVPLEAAERRPAVAVAPLAPLIPASVTKLVTATAALEVLGAAYTFETRIHRTGPILDGVLEGDLGFEGNGDPFLVTERLWLLAHQLRSAGLHQVNGNLIVHASGFPLEDPTASRSLGDTDRSYAARPSGLAANFNSLTLHVAPGTGPGAPATITGDPYDLSYLAVDAAGLRTGAPGGRLDWSLTLESTPEGLRYEDWVSRIEAAPTDSVGVDPVFILPESALEVARVSGVIPVGIEPRTAYRRARYPLPMVATLLRAVLEEFEIEVTGTLRIDSRPPSGEPWTTFPSVSVADLIDNMNRYSSNFTANQLALAVHRKWSAARMTDLAGAGMEGAPIGAAPLGEGRRPGETHVPRTTEGATSDLDVEARERMVRMRLADAGGSLTSWLGEAVPGAADGCQVFDGSGLSVDNRLTAHLLTSLLVRTWDELAYQPKLLASLPGPGEPGTPAPGSAAATNR